MTKNITPTPVYLDPGMHSGLEVKGLTNLSLFRHRSVFSVFHVVNSVCPSSILTMYVSYGGTWRRGVRRGGGYDHFHWMTSSYLFFPLSVYHSLTTCGLHIMHLDQHPLHLILPTLTAPFYSAKTKTVSDYLKSNHLPCFAFTVHTLI